MTLDHIVIPIGREHSPVVETLVAAVASAAGVEHPARPEPPHVSLLAYERLSRPRVVRAIAASLMETAPFVMHAHGYGFFTGDQPTDLSLHVPVVRAPAVDALHERLWTALRLAGADVAGWSGPDHWTPHLTLLNRTLEPRSLGAAATWLARRHHPSWHIAVDRVMVTGGWPDPSGHVIPLGAP